MNLLFNVFLDIEFASFKLYERLFTGKQSGGYFQEQPEKKASHGFRGSMGLKGITLSWRVWAREREDSQKDLFRSLCTRCTPVAPIKFLSFICLFPFSFL